jgi:hypothetical protein
VISGVWAITDAAALMIKSDSISNRNAVLIFSSLESFLETASPVHYG